MSTPTTTGGVRKDVLWQAVETVRGYERSRPAVPFEQAEFDIVCQVLRALNVSPSRLLDLGAGNGLATMSMMARMHVESAVLVDFSPPMLEAAERALAGSSTTTTVVNGDLYDPQWVSGVPQPREYDVVISRHAIHHLPDDRKYALYSEIFDLLRPGGMFVNIEHVRSRALPYQDAFNQVMVESIHALAPEGQSIEDVTAAYRTRMDGELNILADVWEQAQWLERIGYTQVEIPFKALELAVFCGQRPETADTHDE